VITPKSILPDHSIDHPTKDKKKELNDIDPTNQWGFDELYSPGDGL
jgi:hypothetical protein